MNRHVGLTCIFLLGLASLAQAARVEVRFDQQLQFWDGFGVNYVETSQTRDYDEWPQDYGGLSTLTETQQREIIELIFGEEGLQPGLVKMFIDSLQRSDPPETTEPGAIDLSDYDHERTTQNMRRFVREGLQLTRARGDDLTIIGTLYGPPPWATEQNMVRGRDLDPEMKYKVGEYIAAFAKFMREVEGFPVKYLSLHNEGEHPIRYNPDGRDGENLHHHDYNMLWSPQRIVDFLCFMRDILDENGMEDVGVTPGECTHWHWMRPISEAIANDECAMKNIGLITSHGFQGARDPDSDWYSPIASDVVPIRTLRAKRPNLHAWTTSASWGKMDVNFIELIRSHIYDNEHNGFIPWAAVQRHSQWVGGDPNPGCAIRVDDEGNYEVRPGYYLYKQVTRAGKPGMKIAQVESDDPYLGVIAFSQYKTDNPDAFIIFNKGWTPVETEIYVSGTMSESFAVRRTIADTFPRRFWIAEKPAIEHYQEHPNMRAERGTIRYTAPPLSVTTFFGE